MGLDMYLTKRVYVGANYEHRKVTGSIDIKIDGKELPINFNNVSEIIENVGYWRKANHIHRWFVENVQDGEDNCGDYYVPFEKLQELLSLVDEVLSDNSKADELLPVQSGFFFGGTEYNQYYFEDLQLTKNILESLNNDVNGDFYYHSSW